MADERRREKWLWIAAGKALLRGSWELGPHSPPGPAPSWASTRAAASPSLGDSAVAVSIRPWIPTQRIQQQPGGPGGGEEPAVQGAQLLSAPASPFSPQPRSTGAAPPRLRAPPVAPGPADPRSPLTTPDLPAASHPFAHSSHSRADFSPFVHPRCVSGAN